MVEKDIKFSIIVPFYNSEAYIKFAVLSIINQTYNNWELIAVNDGSTDDSRTIVESFNDKRIRIIDKKNGGYSTAINCGLDHVDGDYFLIMGSDDELCLDLLNNVSESIKGKKPDVLSFKVRRHFLDNNSNDTIDESTLFENQIDYVGKYVDFYKKHRYEAIFFALRDTGKIYKKVILKDLRYFGSYGFDADGIFALLFAHTCHSFSTLPIEGYIWNIHKGSLSCRRISTTTNLDRLNNWTNFIKELKKIPKNELIDLDYSYSKIGHSIVCSLNRNAKKAFLKNYFKIYKYYYHLRTLWLKKRGFRGLGKKIFLNAYFPLSFFLFRVLYLDIKKFLQIT